MAKRVSRQDSASEQLPAKISSDEERLIQLAEENTKFERDELVIPRLKMLQPLNPEVQEGTPQYVPGAKAGMLYNTSSGKLTAGQPGMIVCVIGHTRQVIEWIPREAGGGMVRNWGLDDGWKALCEPHQRDSFQPTTRDGHQIDKQRSFLIFDIDEKTGVIDPSFFNMRSTSNKVANRLSTMLTQARIKLSDGRIIAPPHYYYTYKIALEFVTNDKGRWWTPKITSHMDDKGRHKRTEDMPNGKAIFEQAVMLRQQLMEGTIQQQTDDYGEQGDDTMEKDAITF